MFCVVCSDVVLIFNMIGFIATAGHDRFRVGILSMANLAVNVINCVEYFWLYINTTYKM